MGQADSIMNRAGIGNRSEGQFGLSKPSTSGGIQVYDSVVNRSAIGEGNGEGRRFCAECGNPLNKGAKFCTRCGQRVTCPDTS